MHYNIGKIDYPLKEWNIRSLYTIILQLDYTILLNKTIEISMEK